jgi:hypothetical protein
VDEIMYTHVSKVKLIPVKTVLLIRGGEMKESCSRDEFKYDTFDTL